MREIWSLAVVAVAACSSRQVRSHAEPPAGPCEPAARERARARTAERQGRLLVARDALATLAAPCRSRDDDAAKTRLDAALDVGALVERARKNASDAAAAAAAVTRAGAVLERARAARTRLAQGDLGVADEIDGIYREAAAAYEAVVVAKPDVEAIVKVAAVWREADLRVEANRAADRAVVFVEALAGTRLVPQLLPQSRGKLPTDPINGVPSAHIDVGSPTDPDSVELIAWTERGKSLVVAQIDNGLRWFRPGHEVLSSQGVALGWGADPRSTEGWLELLDRAGPNAPIGAAGHAVVLSSRGRSTSPAVSADGERTAVGRDNVVELRSRRDGSVIDRMQSTAAISAIALDAAGKTVAALDLDRGLWIWSPGTPARRLGEGVGQLAISPDGAQVVAQALLGGKLEVRAAATGAVTATLDPGGHLLALAWSAAGLVASTSDATDTTRLALVDPTGGAIRWRATTHDATTVIAPDDRIGFVATGGNDGIVRIWNLRDGKPHGELVATNPVGPSSILVKAAPIAPEWVALSPDGSIEGSTDGDTLLVWRAGAITVPGFVAWDRYRKPGVLQTLLAH